MEGYLYQLDVSVWTALDLVLAKKVARYLVLEPASKEDLEADLTNAPGALVQEAELENYRLVVQCKLRNTGPWKHTELSALLAHGVRRKSAKERLADPHVRYLLITNADADGVARRLQVKNLGDWPKGGDIPTEMAEDLPSDASGRIAVLGVTDSEKIDSRTEKLLTERFRVPRPRVSECRHILRQDALLRMAGAGGGRWTREEIETVVSSCGGFAGDSATLEGFVPPTNWHELRRALGLRHAVIIAGTSGTGKTRAAKALIAELRNEIPGINVIQIAGGPEKINSDLHRPPVAFEIEDPWGRFRLEPRSIPWNDAISEILRTASPDRKFIITSRSDVLRESGPKSLSQRWFVHLEAENYGLQERFRLFENRRPGLPHELQHTVLRYQNEAIDQLTTPLEMQRYFDILADGRKEQENDWEYVKRCLTDAQQSSIESSILNNVRKREDWRWAGVIWGLFKANARQSFNVLPSIQTGLSKCSAEFEDGLEPYVHFLIAGRNLRQNGPVLTYHHPRVELGLEQALNERPQLASRTLRCLIETLISLDVGKSTDWGREGAARIVAATRSQEKLKLELIPATQGQLDDWVRGRLTSTGTAFEDDLRLAAGTGSAACLPAELSRWLLHTRSDEGSFLLDRWSPIPETQQWYDDVKNEPATRPICETFIRRLLPFHSGDFPDDFFKHIDRLCPNLAPAFRDAALSIVRYGYNSNAEPIAEGALQDIDGFLPVAQAAIAYVADLRKDDDGEWLAIANGEYDEEAASHAAESRGEADYTADAFLKAYAHALRKRDGWRALRDHPQAEGMLFPWFFAVSKDKTATDDELAALSQATSATHQEARLWGLACERWRTVFRPFLMSRLTDGTNDADARTEAARALVLHLPNEVPALFEMLLERGSIRCLLELASDLNATITSKEDQERIDAIIRVLKGTLPPAHWGALLAISGTGASQALDAACLGIIKDLDAGNNSRLKLAQARVLGAAGIDSTRLIAELLASSGDDSDSEIAIVTSAVDLAGGLGLWSIVEDGLSHRFADVRERALIVLAARSSGPLLPTLLALAQDKGSRVRRTLVGLMQSRRYGEHTDTLLVLAADTWTDLHHYYGEEARYPIARRAADILCESVQMDDQQASAMLEICRNTSDTSVARTLLAALVRNGSVESQQKVMSLALKTGAPPQHRLASEALFQEYRYVPAALAGQISDQQLLRRAASIAVPMALLVGACAESERVLKATQAVAADSTRRALLVPLWFATHDSREALSREIARMLPQAIYEALLIAVSDGPKLARNSLESLGDFRVTEQVVSSLAILFEPRT